MKSRILVYFILLVVAAAAVLGQGTTSEIRGLRLKCAGASPGYTLFTPMSSDTTYLIDADGKAVRTWKSDFLPSAWVYLLANGNILRGASDRGSSGIGGGGQGGRFQEWDFDGNPVWDFQYNTTRLPHHDVAVLPNGNIVAIVWEAKTADEARLAGRRETSISANGVWPDMLIEFEPQRPNGARIVWEWHSWDHLIQHADPTLENYADPAQRPERIDINGDAATGGFSSRDIFHTNAVAYNPELDQILLSVPAFNEVWVIDHSTTTQEAAGRTGGRSGKGGDLLYRWGNPQAYGRGSSADQLFGFQHDARWIPQGRPGAGHMMVFSNRTPSPAGVTTKVYEFVPPVDAEGRYALPDIGPFGPAAPLWTYLNESLQTTNLSGAERLENGNTLISAGPQGRLFEVTPAGDIVWEYWSPYSGASSGGGSAFSLFRATRIPPDHPGLRGRDLRPLDPQPPISSFATVETGTGGGPCPVSPAPTLTGIQPSFGKQGTSVDVTLTGTNFAGPILAVSGEGVAVSDVTALLDNAVSARLTITADAPPGIRDVTVTTAGGTTAAVAFTVLAPPPTLTSISPGIGARGAGGLLDVTITGTNFVTGLTLEAGDDIDVSDVHVASSTTATAKLNIGAAAALGLVDVSVSTAGGTSGALPFTIADPFPDLSIISSHTGNFGVGFDETYTVTVRNQGAAPTAGAITVTDSLPAGLTFVSGEGPGWTCSASGQVVTCAHSAALAAGDSTRCTLTVAVNDTAAPSVNHSVSVAVHGDLNPVNDAISDPTTVVSASPVLAITPYPLIPGQQATAAVTMSTPFPHDVRGSIDLTFASNAVIPVDDPAIQFASGGRTVTFVIPANEAEARFGPESLRGPLAFQTGTVAGTITLSGTLTAGAVRKNFSPASLDGLTIPLRALSIQSLQTSTQSGFTVSMLLFATAREVTQLNLAFNTVPRVQLSCGATAGCSAAGNTLTLDVAPLFAQWFSGDTTFGGIAQLRLPFSIEGGSVTGTVAVTLKNTQGESNSRSFALP